MQLFFVDDYFLRQLPSLPDVVVVVVGLWRWLARAANFPTGEACLPYYRNVFPTAVKPAAGGVGGGGGGGGLVGSDVQMCISTKPTQQQRNNYLGGGTYNNCAARTSLCKCSNKQSREI